MSETGLLVYQEFWRIVRRHKGYILLALILGVAMGAAYCAVSGPWYDSSVQMLVIKKRLDTTPITGPDHARAHEDYLSTHMLLITSREVVVRAIRKGNLKDLEQFRERGGLRQSITEWIVTPDQETEPEGRQEEKLATEIINALVVSRDAQKPGVSPSSEVLNLSIRGRVAGDCPKILDAIIGSYQDYLNETYRNTNAETLELITQARITVQKDLDAREAAYQKFLADTRPLLKTHDRSTGQQDRLAKIDAKIAALRLRRAEVDASIAMLDKAIKSGRNTTAIAVRMISAPGAGETANPLATSEAWFAGRRQRGSLEEELISLYLQKAKLEENHAPQNVEVRAVNKQIETVIGLILPSTAGGRTSTPDLGTIKLELLKQEQDDLQVAEQSLAKLFESEQLGAVASYMHEIQDEAYRKGIERDRMLYESIMNRLKETSSVRDFGGYNTQVIGPALKGNLAVKKYALIMGLCIFVGLFAGLVWAYVAEMSAKQKAAKTLTSEPDHRRKDQAELNGTSRDEATLDAPA